MTKEELWEMIAQPYTQYPALSKRIAADGGIPIDREVEVEGYTFQLGMLPALETDSTEPDLCVSYALTGDWGNVELAEVPDDLPDLDSH